VADYWNQVSVDLVAWAAASADLPSIEVLVAQAKRQDRASWPMNTTPSNLRPPFKVMVAVSWRTVLQRNRVMAVIG
jgi:hypothetical protein